MIKLPPQKSWSEFAASIGSESVHVWSTPSAVSRMRDLCDWPVASEPPDQLLSCNWLVAVGGGRVIDEAKLLRKKHPGLRLAAIPTIWGSGAEASPIAVWSEHGKKAFLKDDALLPDAVISIAGIGENLSSDLVRAACGDSWAHALEGFLSPLASEATRKDLAEVIKRMIEVGVKNDERWFKLSALACAGQAMSSVGLVHGMAHVLECPSGFGHARLCATLLLPVMNFNKMKSPKWPLLEQHGIREGEILGSLNDVFVGSDLEQLKPLMQQHWRDILKDPCTRTNSALLRPDDLAFFLDFRL